MDGFKAQQQAAAQRSAALIGGLSGIMSAPLGGWARRG
jgi:hypothetical protein